MSNSNRTLLANYLQGTQDPAKRNYIRNPSAHKNVNNITVSGATVTRNTTSPLTSIADIQIGFTTASQTADVAAGILDRALHNSNCELRFNYKLSLGSGANVRVSVRDGSNVTIQQDLPEEATNRPVSINFPCGSSGSSFSVRFEQTAGAVTSTLNVANLYLGQATNVGTVAQAELVGTVKITGCATNWSTSSGSYADFSAVSGCSYAIEGSGIQAPSTNLPGFRLSGQPGKYVFVASGSPSFININTTYCQYRMTDGTSNSLEENWGSLSSGDTAATFEFSFVHNNSLNSNSFRMQAYRSSGSGSCDTQGGSTSPLVFKIYRYPLSSEIAYRSEQVPQTYGIRWAETSSCSWNGTSASYASFAADADCPTPTTYGNVTVPGTKLFNGTFNNVLPGEYEVVFNGVALTDASTNCSYQLWDGTNSIAETNGFNERGASTLIGRVSYDSLANRVIELRYKRVSGSGACRVDAQANAVQLQMKPIKPSVIAPNLVGSVTSLSTGSLRVENIRIAVGANCSASPCTITSSSSNWVSSVTRGGTGNYTLNILSGVFSGPPTCAGAHWNGGLSIQSTTTATSWNFGTNSPSSLADSRDIEVTCVGPRGSL